MDYVSKKNMLPPEKEEGNVEYKRQYGIAAQGGGYESVTEEEYMKNIDNFTLQIMRDSGIIKDVSNIVSKYLYP